MFEPRCTDVVGPVWAAAGESWTCTLPAVHVFDESPGPNGMDRRAHLADDGTWWYDREQIDRAKRADADG